MTSSTTRFLLPYTPRPADQAAPARRQRRAHSLAAFVLAFVLLVPYADAASAQSPDPAPEARAKREEVRRKKAELASQIDLVKASDDEVAAALTVIDGNVAAQNAKVADARKAVEDANRRIEDLAAQIEQSKADIAKVEVAVRKRAIQSYVNPEGSFDTGKFLQSTDIDQAEQRKVLAQTVTGNDRDVIDELKSAKANLAELQRQTDVARAEAETRRQDEQEQLDVLATERAEQAKVKAEWERRLTGLHASEAELTAADADLTAQIQKAQAEQAAREEAARQEAARAQAAAAQRAQAQAAAARSGTSTASNAPTTGSGGTAPAPTSAGPPSGSRPATAGGMIWPIAGRVSQEFHSGHYGMDIFAPCGTPVYAAKGGTVIVAEFNSGGYGNLVVVDHGGGFSTAYAHHQSLSVSVGQTVSQGQQVGLEGTTGRSTGCHLHFETRLNGAAQNPRNYLP